MTPALFAIAALGYLAGSTPFSLLIARLVGGVDLRTVGSGNVGATNVARTLGYRWGAVALLLDALKGALPTWGIPLLLAGDVADPTHQRVLCGLAAVLGHMFPCWLGFKGGKGVATALGVVVVLAPVSSAIALAAFVLVFAVSRIVSLGSIIAAAVFAVSEVVRAWPDVFAANRWSLTVFSLAVPLLIVVRHRHNIWRLWRGEEAALTARPKSSTEPPAESAPDTSV